jgi:hypothetical protein
VLQLYHFLPKPHLLLEGRDAGEGVGEGGTQGELVESLVSIVDAAEFAREGFSEVCELVGQVDVA